MSVPRDFEEFFACLNARGARYLVVGAHAVSHHGAPRFTKDLDILVEPTRGNAERVLAALADFGFREANLAVEDLTDRRAVVQLGFPPLRIDLLASLEGVRFATAWKNRARASFGRQGVAFLGLQDLLRSKRAVGRAQDLGDVEALEAVRRRTRKRRR